FDYARRVVRRYTKKRSRPSEFRLAQPQGFFQNRACVGPACRAGRRYLTGGRQMAMPTNWSFLTRRDLLRLGGLGIGATLLPAARGSAAQPQAAGSARSVIFLWLAGGVTHIDSFDPKPEAPEEIRGTLQTIQTDLPGIRFSEVMPGLARQTRHFALVRSFSHDSNDHFISQARALSGRPIRSMSEILTEPNIGSIVAKLHGARAGFPGYLAVPGTTRPGPPPTNLFTGGWLGRQY